MSREKKEGTYINIRIRQDIYDRFCDYAEEMGQTKTTALERILEHFFEDSEKKQEQS